MACSSSSPKPTNATVAPTVPAPVGIDMCKSPSQDFESGFGTYTQAVNDQFNWTRDSGGTSSFNTGPGVDHTTNSSTGKLRKSQVEMSTEKRN